MNRVNLINIYASALSSNNSFQEKFWAPLNETLVSCLFDKRPCSLSDFHSFYHFFYGLCFTFDTLKLKNSRLSKIGSSNGLSLKIFLGDQENNNSLVKSHGLHVFIHNVSIFYRIIGGALVLSKNK